MKINNKFKYERLERITQENGIRHYKCPITNIMIPSVTTILSETSENESLKIWEENIGTKNANMIKKEAAILGTMVHDRIECYIDNKEASLGNYFLRPLAEKMSNNVIKYGLPKINEVWGQEINLYYPGLYAGTADLIGIYKNKEAIVDYKTSKKMKNKNMIIDYFNQLGAYSLAHNNLYNTNIETCVIFMTTRLGEFKEFVIEHNELKKYQEQFLNRIEKYLNEHE